MTDDKQERVWIEDRDWRIPSSYRKCRWGGRWSSCPNPPAADLRRHSRRPDRPPDQWWAYCSEHLFGRRIERGVVLVAVAVGSPAARAGYVGGNGL